MTDRITDFLAALRHIPVYSSGECCVGDITDGIALEEACEQLDAAVTDHAIDEDVARSILTPVVGLYALERALTAVNDVLDQHNTRAGEAQDGRLWAQVDMASIDPMD